MKFSEFVGNKEAVSRLKAQLRTGQPFHAYLLDGADGIGKRRLAYTFAQALLCRHPEGGEPCQKCDACRKVLNGNHGDIHYVTTDGSSIKDEQIEALQEILQSRPFDGDRTILIIDKADTMTPRAQNRLLKTLEEPGESVVILLLTEKISEILPTILSRCFTLRLKPGDRNEIKRFLMAQGHGEAAVAEIAAAYSCGSPGKAIGLLADEEFQARRKKSIACARGLMEEKSLAEFMALTEEEISGKEAALNFLEMMTFWYRDLLMMHQGMGADFIMNRDYPQELKRFSEKVSLKKICDIIEKLETVKYDIMMNVNINYALKNMYLEINETEEEIYGKSTER